MTLISMSISLSFLTVPESAKPSGPGHSRIRRPTGSTLANVILQYYFPMSMLSSRTLDQRVLLRGRAFLHLFVLLCHMSTCFLFTRFQSCSPPRQDQCWTVVFCISLHWIFEFGDTVCVGLGNLVFTCACAADDFPHRLGHHRRREG